MADGAGRPVPAGDADGGADGDGAERAFEALRAEVAGLRGALVALVEQARRSGEARAAEVEALAAAPDYSPTLGAIARELEGVGARLAAVEASPALRLAPAEHARQAAEAVRQAREAAAAGVEWAGTRLGDAVVELRRVAGAAHDLIMQKRRERAAAVVGAALGFVLWWPLAWGLPWGLGDRLAATLVRGEGRWGAGATLMREADPRTWDRLVRLYGACPKESDTELCEAAMAAGLARAAAGPVPAGQLPAGQPPAGARGPEPGPASGAARIPPRGGPGR